MIRSYIYEPRIVGDVIDTIRIRTGNVGRRKIVSIHLNWFLCWQPFFTSIRIIPEQFFLLGILITTDLATFYDLD